MKAPKIIIVSLTSGIALLGNLLIASSVGAADAIAAGAQAAKGAGQTSDLFGAAGVFTTISNVMLYVIGAVSVVMIIIGGLRYVVSGGNSTAITAAKNTILYAVIGVMVALFAYAMINFVITSFAPGGLSSGGTNV